ncbi:MAG: response regulator [Myxococcota bacterium]
MDFFERLRQVRLLSDAQLQQVRQRVLSNNEDWASAICALKLVPERDVVQLLAEHSGYPGLELTRTVFPLANLALIPEELLRKKALLPVMDVEGSLLLAMAEPDDGELVAEIGFMTGRKILPHVAVRGLILAALSSCRALMDSREQFWRGREAWKLSPGPEGRASVVRAGANRPPPKEDDDDIPTIVGVELEEKLEVVGLLDPLVDSPEPLDRGRSEQPRRPVDPEAAKTTLRGSVGVGKVILVVDDEPEMRALARRIVAPFDCAVSECGNGKEALERVHELSPDLVLLDAMLPGLHGFEVCRAIKGNPALRRTKVLMMSGIHTGWKVGVDVSEVYGADGFFEKPFKVEDFTRAIRRCLMSSTSGDEQIAKARRESAMATCREAAVRARAQKTSEAIELLRAAAAKDPYCAEAHFYLGQMLRANGEPYLAIASLERAAELRPDLDDPLLALGETYLRQGFRKTAVEVFQRALEVCRDPARRATIEAKVKEKSDGTGRGA